MWLKEQGYQDISLFGFSAGGVVVANEIQKDYAGIWHAAVVASAPVNWTGMLGIFQSAQTAHKAKVPTSFIAPIEDGSYDDMLLYYSNMVVHKQWHNWYDGHDPFPNTCKNHTASYPPGETVEEATSNWYLKVFDVAIVKVTPTVKPKKHADHVLTLNNLSYESHPKPPWLVPFEINVTVKNEGDFSQTFNVTAYCNDTVNQNCTKLGTQTVTNLNSGAEKNLTFTWNPYLPGYPDNKTAAWPYPNYTFSANATIVPGETDTADNTYTDGFVKVKWSGDANGDGHVNVVDLGMLGYSWLTKVGDEKYDPRVDFNMDGEVNILDQGIMGVWWLKGPLD